MVPFRNATSEIRNPDGSVVFQAEGIEAFEHHERENALKPLPEGPFARLLMALSYIQGNFKNADGRAAPIRTALVTARSSPAHERVIRTLRAWNVTIDETFFMGGVAKSDVLAAFGPHMFFDDQPGHCVSSALGAFLRCVRRASVVADAAE